jgi:hypothetical protein
VTEFNFSLDNIKTSLFGYKKSEIISRMNMIHTNYAALMDEFKKEVEKNKKLEESLKKKNLECFEKDKEIKKLQLALSGGTPASSFTEISFSSKHKDSLEDFPEDDPDKTSVLKANMSTFIPQESDDMETEVLTSTMAQEVFNDSKVNDFRNIDEDVFVGEVEDKKSNVLQIENIDDEEDIIFLD